MVVALAAYWRKGGFEPVAGLLNADGASARRKFRPTPLRPPRAPAAWRPLSARVRFAAVAIFVLGLAALLSRSSGSASADLPHHPATGARSRGRFLRAQNSIPRGFNNVTYPGGALGRRR